MYWPPAIHTTDLVFTVARDASGDVQPIVVGITPVLGGISQIVYTDGTVLTADADRLLVHAGIERHVPIPVTDQPGWTDPAGHAFTGWHYIVSCTYGFGGRQSTVVHTLQPVDGQDTVVVTQVPITDQVGDPTTSVIPAVLSVNGQTGHVVIGTSEGGGVDGPTVAAAISAAIEDHVDDPLPHPAYDDIPSLVLAFENALSRTI